MLAGLRTCLADRLQQDRLHRLCEPPTAQTVEPSQTEDHGTRSLPQLQVVRNFERYANKDKAKHGEGHMPLTNVSNSTSPNGTEFCRPMSVIYGEKTFQNLHQRPAMLSQQEWWISTPPVSYGK